MLSAQNCLQTHLLNVTVSCSLSLAYVLTMYLFVCSNSSDHSCCFKDISGLLQRHHSLPTCHSWETRRRKKEKCYLTTKVWNQYVRAQLSKIPHLYLHACTLRTNLCFCKQSLSHCSIFLSLVFEKYFETLRREILQYSIYLPN